MRVAEKSEDVQVLLDLAVAYLEMGLLVDAVETIEALLELDPQNARAKEMLERLKLK